jgi:hypothetical protein
MVEIKKVETKGDLKKFIDFPIALYRHNPNWSCSLYSEEWNTLDTKKNPAYAWCEAVCFLALRDGKVVGRIGGIINLRYNEKIGEKRLRFTRPDFIDDEEVSKALIEAVENWGREKGMDKVHGPIGFCDLDKQGMLVEGFDRPSITITVYNAPYYQTHFEKAGYQKEADWMEFRIGVPENKMDRLERLAAAVEKRSGVHKLELHRAKDIKPYVKEVFDLINATYAIFTDMCRLPTLKSIFMFHSSLTFCKRIIAASSWIRITKWWLSVWPSPPLFTSCGRPKANCIPLVSSPFCVK